MSEHHDPDTESQIRNALGQRADATVVSADALDKIRSPRSASGWARPVVYAAVAGVIAVLVGGVLYLGPEESADPIDAVDDITTTLAPETTAPPTTTPDPDNPTTVDPPLVPAEFDPTAVNANGIAGANLRSHPFDVIAAGLELASGPDVLDADGVVATFLGTQLRLDAPVMVPAVVELPEVQSGLTGDVAAYDILQLSESGEPMNRPAFTVVAARLDGAVWQVTHVFTQSFRVHTVESNTPETLRVTGTGSAFEGTGHLNVGLDDTIISVGSGGFGDFSVVVPRPTEEAPITVRVFAPAVVDGQFPNITMYRTWPIDTSTTLSVFGVADDDVLNVRSGPGTTNEIIHTLAPDASGVLHTGATEFVNGERWWEIDDDGERGWVNSRFLVVHRDIALTAGLDGRMWESILMPLSGLDPANLAPRVDLGGIGVYADWPTPWTTIDRDDLDLVRNYSPDGTEDRCDECDRTAAEFLGFDTAKWDLAEYTVPAPGPEDVNWGWSHGLPPEFFDRFTTGSISIPEPNPDESLDWREYTVVFDFDDGTPVVRGIWRWGWTP